MFLSNLMSSLAACTVKYQPRPTPQSENTRHQENNAALPAKAAISDETGGSNKQKPEERLHEPNGRVLCRQTKIIEPTYNCSRPWQRHPGNFLVDRKNPLRLFDLVVKS